MSVEDAQYLYGYIEELEKENALLKERLIVERQATDKYFLAVNDEREAREKLAVEMNAELKHANRSKYKWGFGGMLAGALIMAIAD